MHKRDILAYLQFVLGVGVGLVGLFGLPETIQAFHASITIVAPYVEGTFVRFLFALLGALIVFRAGQNLPIQKGRIKAIKTHIHSADMTTPVSPGKYTAKFVTVEINRGNCPKLKNCRAYLDGLYYVSESGTKRPANLNVRVQLRWSGDPNPFEIDITDKGSDRIVLLKRDEREPHLWFWTQPHHLIKVPNDLLNFFKERGEYVLRLRVTADNAPSQAVYVSIHVGEDLNDIRAKIIKTPVFRRHAWHKTNAYDYRRAWIALLKTTYIRAAIKAVNSLLDRMAKNS